MSTRLYGDYFIRALPSFDTARNGWVPQADVSWSHASPHRKFTFLKFPERFTTEEEAITRALDMAQRWVDRRNRRSRSRIGAEHWQVLSMLRALKEGQKKAAPKEARLTQMPTERRREKIFTLGEFRSAIARNRLKINEQTLHKSYLALDTLRNHKHLSWTQTRSKVEHLQQNLKAARPALRRARMTRVPLTERAWDKIE